MAAPAEPIVVLVDALGYLGKPNLVGLFELVNDFPAWVRWVCTTRPNDAVTRHFAGPETAVIPLESNDNQADIRSYVLGRLSGGAFGSWPDATKTSKELEERVLDLVDGNFLYAKLMLDGARSAAELVEQLEMLPKGLDQYYVGLLGRLSRDTWEEPHQSLLSALAVAQEPLTEEQFAGIISIKQTAARRILMQLRPVLERGAPASRVPCYGL
jgi:hypothetical protein